MSEALDPEPLLRALDDAGVRYIIIGGFAVNAHGVIRPSKDLDIYRTAARLHILAPTAISVGNPSNKKSVQVSQPCLIHV